MEQIPLARMSKSYRKNLFINQVPTSRKYCKNNLKTYFGMPTEYTITLLLNDVFKKEINYVWVTNNL